MVETRVSLSLGRPSGSPLGKMVLARYRRQPPLATLSPRFTALALLLLVRQQLSDPSKLSFPSTR